MYLDKSLMDLNSGLENNPQYFDRRFITSWVFAMFLQFLPQALDVLSGHISTTGEQGCYGFLP